MKKNLPALLGIALCIFNTYIFLKFHAYYQKAYPVIKDQVELHEKIIKKINNEFQTRNKPELFRLLFSDQDRNAKLLADANVVFSEVAIINAVAFLCLGLFYLKREKGGGHSH